MANLIHLINERKVSIYKGTKKFLSVKDVAHIMGISIPTARKLFDKRDFPAIRAGRRLIVSAEAFNQYILQRHS